MSGEKRSFFAKVFMALMIFTGLCWVWTVAFIIGWPWDQTSVWKPEYRVAAICADDQACSIPYGQLDEARTQGRLKSLDVPDVGEVMEERNWIKWSKTDGLIEAKASSWHFQTTVRYRLEEGKPALVAVQDVGAKALYFGMAAALFSLIGLYLRKLRG